MGTLRAGAMRHRVRIEELSTERSSSGEPSTTWTLVDEVWAAVEPLQGREFFSAQQMGAKHATEFRMRYRADVRPRMRLVWDARQFNIVSVASKGGLKRELTVLADELVEVPT
jgi:SPP1 family predicted phage head-tail adaptor